MDSVLVKKIKQLEAQIKVMTNEYGTVDIAIDGLVPKKEGGPVVTGIMGGKGALANETDLDTVTHGGAYFVPQGLVYYNLPFNASAPGQLEVIRNFGQNPNTSNPLVFQLFTTFADGQNKSATRVLIGGNWGKWHYPEGETLWSGAATNGSTITLLKPTSNYVELAITWGPFGQPARQWRGPASMSEYQASALNQPNDMGSSTPTIMTQELNLKVNTDLKTLTINTNAFLIRSGSITPDQASAGQIKVLSIKGFTDA